jgi:hypothetical protein
MIASSLMQDGKAGPACECTCKSVDHGVHLHARLHNHVALCHTTAACGQSLTTFNCQWQCTECRTNTWYDFQLQVVVLQYCTALVHLQRFHCRECCHHGISSPEYEYHLPFSGLPSSSTFIMPLLLSSTSTHPAPPAHQQHTCKPMRID